MFCAVVNYVMPLKKWENEINVMQCYCLEGVRRTIEVSVPVAVASDSSKEDSVSPASTTSIRR